MHRNLDGIKKAPKRALKIPETKTTSTKEAPQNQANANRPVQSKVLRSFNLLNYIDTKQTVTIAATFAITFVLSIATSRILALPRGSSQGQILGASTDNAAANNAAVGIQVSSQPQQTIPFNSAVQDQPGQVFLPNENVYAPDPLLHRKEFLKQYLTEKKSPLAGHVDAISEQSQWKLIIAIAQAESSSCKKYPEHSANCWGIGGANNLMKFPDLDSAIAHVNSLLENKYVGQGLSSPQQLAPKWVGHKSDGWEQAVQQELDNLKGVQ